MQLAAAVTMVRDDAFFLRAWVRYYGQLLGRENCYVINHGRAAEMAEITESCNIIGIPGDPHRNFDIKRWGLLNGLVGGLRRYYGHVIVGDVDELVVVDPISGQTLPQLLAAAPTGQVLTPVGLEVVHHIDREQDPISDTILGPRRHVRPAPNYSKPCIISAPTKIARGGHFSQYPKLHTHDHLYLMHLKYCDFAVYSEAMNRRNAVVSDISGSIKDIAVGRHWFSQERGDDRALFEGFAGLDVVEGFDMTPLRDKMHKSWGPRGDTGYYAFNRRSRAVQFILPHRFFGLI